MLYEPIQQGDEEWYAVGRQIGLSEGKQIGLSEGERLGLHEALDIVLAQKFGKVPPACAWLLQEASVPTLYLALKLAWTSPSVNDFVETLQRGPYQ